ncbi:chaperone for protein-folding within the ER, fungal-domain-containing protein [Panaeolus papilionaceus]|nr:chaperone for protein-folding within the ER, fungal-domain-containing protein [Panaeolus papilionaceus]
MKVTSTLTVLLASLVQTVLSQDQFGPIQYDSIHNATAITGTWSSGSKNVVTGAGFADPVKVTFTYPKTTGVSYSFSDSMHYEIARYRFNSNGSEPTCITGIVSWVHGTYSLNANGSITMTPFPDGFQQIQDPCAAVSNFVEPYEFVEYYKGWRIFLDPNFGPKLHLFQFDGQPVAPMFQVSPTPNMLPTQPLRNIPSDVGKVRRSTSSASSVLDSQRTTVGLLFVGAVAMVLSSLLL